MEKLFKLMSKDIQAKFEGHGVKVYDMDDALYIEDPTDQSSYTYLLGTKQLIKHEE